jgi:hypothetical protein
MDEAKSGPTPPLSSQVLSGARRGAFLVALVGLPLLLYSVYSSLDFGVHVTSLLVVPPAPGECIGRIEATVVNRTSHAVEVGGLHVRLDDRGGLSEYIDSRVFPLREGGPEFWMFSTRYPVYGGERTLGPWSSCVRGLNVIRVRGGGAVPVSRRSRRP